MTSNLRSRGVVALLGLCLAFGAAPGCGEAEENERMPRRVVAVDEMPATVLDAAKKRLTGVEFTDSWANLNPDGTVHSYEVRGRAANGKVREVRVGLDGAILEEE